MKKISIWVLAFLSFSIMAEENPEVMSVVLARTDNCINEAKVKSVELNDETPNATLIFVNGSEVNYALKKEITADWEVLSVLVKAYSDKTVIHYATINGTSLVHVAQEKAVTQFCWESLLQMQVPNYESFLPEISRPEVIYEDYISEDTSHWQPSNRDQIILNRLFTKFKTNPNVQDIAATDPDIDHMLRNLKLNYNVEYQILVNLLVK